MVNNEDIFRVIEYRYIKEKNWTGSTVPLWPVVQSLEFKKKSLPFTINSCTSIKNKIFFVGNWKLHLIDRWFPTVVQCVFSLIDRFWAEKVGQHTVISRLINHRLDLQCVYTGHGELHAAFMQIYIYISFPVYCKFYANKPKNLSGGGYQTVKATVDF